MQQASQPHLKLKSLGGTLEGYLDIEATQLKADFGFMLTACIKIRGKNKIYKFRTNRKEILHELYDYGLCQKLGKTLTKFNTIYTYYGEGFDIPFIKTRFLDHNLEDLLPEYGLTRHIDLYKEAKKNILTHRRRLETITRFMKILGKTPISDRAWKAAATGNPKALNQVMLHNIGDVIILEKFHERISRFMSEVKRTSL